MIATTDFLYALHTRGWIVVPDVVEPALLDRLGPDLERAVERCRHVQTLNGLPADHSGAAHHILGAGDSLDELLQRRYLLEGVAAYLGGPPILNSYGGVVNHQESSAYFKIPHRDIRSFTGGAPLMLTMMILIDDFTAENGATRLLSGSHHHPDKPSDAWFQQHADRLIGPRGSVACFDANLWHAAGTNTTPRVRRGLTLTFTRSFIKPQLDYLRLLGPERLATLDAGTQQLLGCEARVPGSLEEWYLPRDQRFYRGD